MTTIAPTTIPNVAPTYVRQPSSAPIVVQANAEIEFSSHLSDPNGGNSEYYFSTDAPVDVDEALNDEPASQNWVTTDNNPEENYDENAGENWNNDNAGDNWNNDNAGEDWNNQENPGEDEQEIVEDAQENNWNDNAGDQQENWNNEDQVQQNSWNNEAAPGGDVQDNWNNQDEQKTESGDAWQTVQADNENKGGAFDNVQAEASEAVPINENEGNNNNTEAWQTIEEDKTDDDIDQVISEETSDKIEGEKWNTIEEKSKEDSKEFATVNETSSENVTSAAAMQTRKRTSPRRMAATRKYQSLDLNLNVDGAASICSGSSGGEYWHNYSFMKHKASFLYGNAWSRRTSDASSFVSNAQEIEDLYCDDEISPNLENDPNMMLTSYYRNAAMANNNDINFPERPCLTDRGKNL